MEPCIWLPDRFTFCWCTQWTHSDVWSQLATTQQCSFTIAYRQSQKKWRNCDRRAICNATRRFGAGRGVVCHLGGSDGSDGARPLWRSHSARTEMFFADGSLLNEISCYCLRGCGRNILDISAYKGCHLLVYVYLWSSPTHNAEDARPVIIDIPLTLIFKMGQGVFGFLILL